MSRGPNGPNQEHPARCTTIELKDLADTDEFDLSAEVGSVYGFEYTDAGFYKRIEIEDKKTPKLEQLRNVTADSLFNAEYRVIRIGPRWFFRPKVTWDIKYEFISPYTLFDLQNKFRKAFNAGRVHCSLVPNSESRGKIEIKELERQYMLSSTTASGLNFIPQIDFSEHFTLIFEVIIRDDHLDNSVDNQSIEILGGVQMNWLRLTKDKNNVTVVLRKDGEGVNGMRFAASVDEVTIHIVPVKMNGLKFFDLTRCDLVGLYYKRTDLPDKLIEMLTTLQINN